LKPDTVYKAESPFTNHFVFHHLNRFLNYVYMITQHSDQVRFFVELAQNDLHSDDDIRAIIIMTLIGTTAVLVCENVLLLRTFSVFIILFSFFTNGTALISFVKHLRHTRL